VLPKFEYAKTQMRHEPIQFIARTKTYHVFYIHILKT